MAKFCMKCGNELNGDNFCSKCGEKNGTYTNNVNANKNKKPENNGLKVLRILIGCFLFIIGIGGCFSVLFSEDENSENNNTKYSYEVTKEYNDSANIAHYIEGTVTNNTNREKGYLQIEFVCYDKDNINLGTAMANTNNLKAGETWKFKAMSMFSDVKNIDHCNFEDIKGW